MQIKNVGKSFWFAALGLFIVWLILGFVLPLNVFTANDMFDIASLAAFFAATAFVVIYSAAGFIGPKPRAKWWENEVGTYLVLSFAAVMFIVGPAAFADLFNGGLIDSWWWIWAWIGGHFMAAFMIGSLSFVWLRSVRHREA